ncbi:hypothetical protein FISHEDRAFT_58657 [Fistulina hepatica ATCC 64428]|uniref:C2H2-type domain-containing protein n=1 Tax=Fistulina hepatica ATCC 64428 TaxID=1128425 RepID=A0A0D7ADT4_9AGAR|nr:hypothetical protein FISHEDRAFT_58657 [Fistulina hepatica ATCC 64428]
MTSILNIFSRKAASTPTGDPNHDNNVKVGPASLANEDTVMGDAERRQPDAVQDTMEDPAALLASLSSLIKSVPPSTMHSYTLSHLNKVATSELACLSSFFSKLEPPPRLHCVRCHKYYFDIENTDRSCLVAHDDDSAEVERIGGGYETTYECCGKTVEGEGDMGPPDGWCFEGVHTTDLKRARFRADSTIHDDKLVSCLQAGCLKRSLVSELGHESESESIPDEPEKKRRRTRSVSSRGRAVKKKTAPVAEDDASDVGDAPAPPKRKPMKPRSSAGSSRGGRKAKAAKQTAPSTPSPPAPSPTNSPSPQAKRKPKSKLRKTAAAAPSHTLPPAPAPPPGLANALSTLSLASSLSSLPSEVAMPVKASVKNKTRPRKQVRLLSKAEVHVAAPAEDDQETPRTEEEEEPTDPDEPAGSLVVAVGRRKRARRRPVVEVASRAPRQRRQKRLEEVVESSIPGETVMYAL